MRLNSLIIWTSLLVCCCTTCQNTPTQYNFQNVTPAKQTTFQKAVTKARLVPLELTDSSSLKAITKVIQHDGRFYILDGRSYKVFVFNLAGKFEYQIANPGPAPSYINIITDFELDVDKKRLNLMSPKGKIVTCSLTGDDFKTWVNAPDDLSPLTHFTSLQDGNIWCYQSSQPYKLTLYNPTTKTVIRQADSTTYRMPTMGHLSPFYTFSGKHFFLDPYRMELRRIDTASVNLRTKFSFGERDIRNYPITTEAASFDRFNDFLSENDIYWPIASHAETANHFGLTVFRAGTQAETFLYDKTTAEWTKIAIPHNHRFIPFMSVSPTGALIGTILEPALAAEILTNIPVNPQILKQLTEVPAEPNPALLIYTF